MRATWQAFTVGAAISITILSGLPQCVGADESTTRTTSPSPSKSPGSEPNAPVSSSPDTRNVPSRHLTRGQLLARTALAYRGVPYRFGGRSPRSGFDCSGLVQTVYAKWGIYLPRAARAQYTQGIPVKPGELQAGDLVFLKNTYKRGLSHVGIYIGAGCFIHAARPGKGVCLSRLSDTYNRHHWAGARRLKLEKLPPTPHEKPVENVIVDIKPETVP